MAYEDQALIIPVLPEVNGYAH